MKRQHVCTMLLLFRMVVAIPEAVVNPVRMGEFKFVGIVRFQNQFKCLAVLVSLSHVLSPCDCVGRFVDEDLFEYHFPDHLKVVAGMVRGREDEEDPNAQTRTPYVLKKHPQCMPYVKRAGPQPVNWTMYNYGLMTMSVPFRLDYRVAPIDMSSQDNLGNVISDVIKTEAECKTVSFPIHSTNASMIFTHMEWSHVQLQPTSRCQAELCSTSKTPSKPANACVYDDFYFFGKFCGTERFLKSRDDCFNNSGAPVICGGTYVGHLGDNIECPMTSKGRFFMYVRFDWAVPFITQSVGMILKSSVLIFYALLFQFQGKAEY